MHHEDYKQDSAPEVGRNTSFKCKVKMGQGTVPFNVQEEDILGKG